MRQVFGEWGVVTETKSTSYGILSAPVASTIRGISHIVSEPARKRLSARCTLRFVETFFNRLKGMFSTYILSQLEISFLTESSKSPASIAKSNKQWVGTCLYQEECKLFLINCGAAIRL